MFLPFKIVFLVTLFLFSIQSLYSQNVIGPANPKFTNPGILGKLLVNPLGAQWSLYAKGLLIATDKNISKIYGESGFDNEGGFRISDLPTNEELFIHIVFQSWLVHTEKITITDWTTKNIFIDIETYDPNSLEKKLGNSILGLIGLAGHYAEIIIQGEKIKSAEALIRTLHYMRIVGNWEVTGEIFRGNPIKKNIGAHLVFNNDGSGEFQNKDKKNNFSWDFRVEENDIIIITKGKNDKNSEMVFRIRYNIDNNYMADYYKKDNFDKTRVSLIKIEESKRSIIEKNIIIGKFIEYEVWDESTNRWRNFYLELGIQMPREKVSTIWEFTEDGKRKTFNRGISTSISQYANGEHYEWKDGYLIVYNYNGTPTYKLQPHNK